MDDAKDGGICADAEGEGQNRDQGEARVLQELAKGIAQVLQKAPHAIPPIPLETREGGEAFPVIRRKRRRPSAATRWHSQSWIVGNLAGVRYSYRRATSGSTRVARQAGKLQASNATRASAPAAAASDMGS
jgi:hypothetical protein